MTTPAELPSLLETFFIKRLMAQRNVSQHTIASYRDTFRLLLQCKRLLNQSMKVWRFERLRG